MGSRRLLPAALLAVVLTALVVTPAVLVRRAGLEHRRSTPARTGHWLGGWGTAQATADRLPCGHCTLRNVVHLSVGGTAVRIRLANTYGKRAVTIGHVTVALPAQPGATAAPALLREVTFAGVRTVRVPAGAAVASDPVPLTVTGGRDLLVSLYLPRRARVAVSYHPSAHQTNYLAGGDASTAGAAPFRHTTTHWYLLDGVDVRTADATGTVVAWGDSITDGTGSSTDANRRWPDLLADRLAGRPPGRRHAVLDAGIAGNRLVRDGPPDSGVSALTRLGTDVPAGLGVRTVIVLEGINDIQFDRGVTAAALIAGYRTMVATLHARGVRVVGSTLLPYAGARAWTPAGDAVRVAVNSWIRTSGVFDAVLDADAALRDPADPSRLTTEYDSGDHLHPGDAGYAALAATVDLTVL
ncbi:SGNH hydrolase [Actinocatenispora thailandica]|uniref:SGNH hydrolase n=1 Tax=Actinocatenispora thailandica TaxID=227318 RepID=A0A7R7DP07_9ACTN|nr:SGNH/GDSL hydrolase family protein [Actinocatenispora thailandica]BCJ35041.1 SGNH hydrolase [Actinocatenispora thailandica]